MKPQMSSSSSSMKSTTITMEDDFRTETRDSCYYPGCRKDDNCNCEMCLASINATLDLMSFSVQKSSFTKLSASKPKFNHLPISFNPSVISTPGTSSCCLVESPALKSTARLNAREKKMKEKEEKKKKVLTSEIVRTIGERASMMQDLNAKMRSKNLGMATATAGLLATGFSSKSFTILSGRVTEWSNGKHGFVTRKANASWEQSKWGASVVQLDPKTWIIEYQRCSILEHPRLISATLELLKHRLTKW
ncbi:UDP-glucose:flavonoid 7-O-glucosyltransferase [Hibiscus syriacus]|uniref:UDP-glucose:flavonoid 7-O-glucosyltransferase n=1 Tax=Hibiscus syriacus TaxID=106335 RepID=A0A6A2Z8U3_HIBSY|nr:UDP-glucose:flavonoid 7-O-glucosyltransferase [Hibiscus syriacus]